MNTKVVKLKETLYIKKHTHTYTKAYKVGLFVITPDLKLTLNASLEATTNSWMLGVESIYTGKVNFALSCRGRST